MHNFTPMMNAFFSLVLNVEPILTEPKLKVT